MTEFFQSITIELDAGGWQSLNADVLNNPRPRGSIGIMGNGPTDRVADGGRFSFSLNNSETSAGGLGYWSIGAGANILEPGSKIRVGFQYNNVTRYKWVGYIEPDGLDYHLGNKGLRRVDVKCRDWFGLINTYNLDFLDYATNKRIEEAVALVVAELPASLQPQYTEYSTGTYTFPDVFDIMKGETKVIGEFNKLAQSELGYIYAKGNEYDGLTLVVESKLRRFNLYDVPTLTAVPVTDSENTSHLRLANGTDELLLANGTDKLLLAQTQTLSFDESDILNNGKFKSSFGAHYYSHVKASTVPRKVDTAATTVLWTMEGSILVTAGATVNGIRGRYRDPSGGASYINGIEMVPPVATTDFQAFANADGTGTNYTANCSVTAAFGTAEVEISITNTGGASFYTGGDILFQVRGKGVYIYDTTDIYLEQIDEDTTRIGRNLLTMDLPYHGDAVEVRRVLSDVSFILGVSRPSPTIEAYPMLANRDKTSMQAFMYLEPGTLAAFAATLVRYSDNAFINGYSFEIIDGKYVEWAPLLGPVYIGT